MDRLRTPFFVAAVVLLVMSVCISSGTQLFLSPPSHTSTDQLKEKMKDVGIKEGLTPDEADAAAGKTTRPSTGEGERTIETPPGVGVVCLTFIDGLLLFNVLIMAMSMFTSAAMHGRMQGIVMLIVYFLLFFGAIIFLFVTVNMLLLMLTLLITPPFGTIAYLSKWGGFPKETAAIGLGMIMSLKLAFALCLMLAHQSFLKIKSLVLLVLLSLLLTFVVGFLHGYVPGILASITDAIGGIVILIVVLIWSFVGLIFSLIAVIKAIF